MARLAKAEEAGIYAAAQQWVDAALRSDDSLFTPGEPIWSLETLNEFLQRVDSSSNRQGNFLERFEWQLASARPDTIQLAAEILYVHFLIHTDDAIKGSTKRDQIMKVLGWARRDAPLPESLDKALDSGVCNPSASFNIQRHLNLRLVARLAQKLKQQSEDQRAAALGDPWEFKQSFRLLTDSTSYLQASALLHLVYPDKFERILPQYHKDYIVNTFAGLLQNPSKDIDYNLLTIRERLSEAYGKALDFYDAHLWAQWDPDYKRTMWDQFIHWARRFVEHQDFDQEERDFKIEISQNLQQARSAVEAEEDDWVYTLRDVFNMKSNNLTSWRAHGDFLEWCREHPTDALAAMHELWSEKSRMKEAVSSFSDHFPDEILSGTGTRTRLISFLLMAFDPYKYPRYMFSEFSSGYRLTGYPLPDSKADEAETYYHALGFLDTILSEASARGLALRDPLDAQSALWAVTSSGWYKEVLPEDEHEAFLGYREGSETLRPPEPVEPPARTLESVAADLHYNDVSYLEEIERLLEDKRQVVFYGPPGTGKTFVAEKLARHFAGAESRTALVQFHPSYAYEDFVEGFRPAEAGGFSLREGPLKRIARRAGAEPDPQRVRHVLVIDEVNRGNLAKVFGELYYLLEYRDQEISLQYSDDQFQLPKNLWIIATMNTADRSIALVDAALRRRFYFVPFFPDEPPIEGLLDRWLRDKEKPEMLWVAEVVDAANQILEELDKRDMAIGPSHFMRDDLDDEWVKRIWKHSILPYVEEQLFGETERVKEFELDTLRGKVEPPAGGEPAGASEPQGD